MRNGNKKTWIWLAVILLSVISAWLLWRYWPWTALLFDNADRLQQWFRRWGSYGPLAFLLLNALQVVLAPLPGYVVGVTGGYLFGAFVGSLAALSGMLLGGWAAMLLGRIFGRPLVARLVGAKRMARWDHLARENRRWPWLIMFLGPFGDLVFYVAGLSRVPLWQLLLLALASRGPAVMASVIVGAGLQRRSFLYALVSFLPWLIIGVSGIVIYEKNKDALRDGQDQRQT